MEKAFLIGIRHSRESQGDMRTSLQELEQLVETAEGTVLGRTWQEIKRASSATLIHRGKIDDVRDQVESLAVDTVIVDAELTPAQNRNLARTWKRKVLDRTAVILDIFARRAQSKAGKLQVELAQLQYRLPRLSGSSTNLMQQAGYIGNRGPGETKLEVDRRRIRERISSIRRQLERVRQHRALHRAQRERAHLPLVSLVGYTNAGKSTLMNALTQAGVLAENQLFATLDPAVRRLHLPSGRAILLADTVGLIRRLPHDLVEAFNATFEEMARSDLLCHLVDVSSPKANDQKATVESVLQALKLDTIPQLTVYTKIDRLEPHHRPTESKDAVAISAPRGIGLGLLLETIEATLDHDLQDVRLSIPHAKSGVLNELYEQGHVSCVVHGPEAIHVEARIPRVLLGKCKSYVG